jgi:hypothetical protein
LCVLKSEDVKCYKNIKVEDVKCNFSKYRNK